MNIQQSELIFLEDHIWDAVDNRILSFAVRADQLSLYDVSLNLLMIIHPIWFDAVFWGFPHFRDNPQSNLLENWVIPYQWLFYARRANLIFWWVFWCFLYWIRFGDKWIFRLRWWVGNCFYRIWQHCRSIDCGKEASLLILL